VGGCGNDVWWTNLDPRYGPRFVHHPWKTLRVFHSSTAMTAKIQLLFLMNGRKKSVTHVLTHIRYRCPDCTLRPSSFTLHTSPFPVHSSSCTASYSILSDVRAGAEGISNRNSVAEFLMDMESTWMNKIYRMKRRSDRKHRRSSPEAGRNHRTHPVHPVDPCSNYTLRLPDLPAAGRRADQAEVISLAKASIHHPGSCS
jgi:hypothetical protein